ncbi:uncharacterized protein TM35_000074890 [Trypanosoma theileri]|uniref:Uncharacterized protein n=1 Tax=Trypanosoma theileri TaxID=67003 RepID=A0A1X0P2D9_9TRYP|nr:uncharacterized protein TM35_000074890 [Trypanosoma theileri]ORC91065.1 hypothetical protein TM35_000074890 [Trypanosoma theileri]
MQRRASYTGVPTYRQGYVSPSGTKVQYSNDWVKFHALEGDGLRTLLYMHLWKKNKGSESALKSVRLPDTVVYEHNFPRAWYTYDAESKEINKHPGRMLDAQSIYQHFSQTQNGCDVVAQFLTTCVPQDGSESTEESLLTYMEYFTAETLREFLFGHTRKPDGILQKFVIPKGETTTRRNAQLQVMWSPLMTVVYKRTSKHKLDDAQVPIHVRSATFDGDCNLSELTLVADESKGRLERICREVVDHVYFTDRKLITRMVLNFKVDDANRVWLLWCSSLRVSGDSLNPRNLRVPLMLSMRTEILNDGSSTKDRSMKRRERQQRLLVMDKQLFEFSRDYEFGYYCNSSHVRECKRLALTPKAETRAGDSPRRGPPHPLHDAMRYLIAPTPLPTGPEAAASSSGTAPQQPPLLTPQKHHTGKREEPQNNIEERIKNELTAMALDAWYSVYSSTLSESPDSMPTRMVALAEPLVVVLKPKELARLLDILGLEKPEAVSTPSPSPSPPPPTTTTTQEEKKQDDDKQVEEQNEKPQQPEVSLALRTVTMKRGVDFGSGRRLDRPLINAERDVRELFEEIFSSREEEIVKHCLSNKRWIW